MASSQQSRFEESPVTERVTVRLPAPLLDAIEAAVDAGEYPNRSQAIREPLQEAFEDGPDHE